jgi:HD-like signal output (HDOD) protein
MNLVMPAPLTAEQTFARAQALLQSGRSVALPELLHLIETLSTGDATVPEIAELIEKDPALLGKVLSLANTVAHNPGIAPIRTLSQALHRIGYQRVRSMAVSLLLLESAGGTSVPPEQREAASGALCAGLLAQGIAESLGTHDAELAFACATLRHFGRILMAALSPELFREAQQLGRTHPPEESGFRRRFGLTSLELSRRVLAAARLPAEVLATLRDAEPEALYGTATKHETRLAAIADYGTRLGTLSMDRDAGHDVFLRQAQLLARRFERLLPDAGGHIKPAFRSADQRLRSYLRCKGVRSLPTFSLTRVRQRLESVAPEVRNEGDGTIASLLQATPAPVGNNLGSTPPIPAPAPAEPPLADGPETPELAAAPVAAAPEFPIDAETSADPFSSPAARPPLPAIPTAAEDPELATLTLLRDGFGAHECWLFVVPEGEATYHAACGAGAVWSHVDRRARFHAGERSVFGICVTRHETVLIHNAAAAATRPYVPDWLQAHAANLGAFVLVPLSGGTSARGLALIGWRSPRQIALSPAQLGLARQLLGPLVTARLAPAAVA